MRTLQADRIAYLMLPGMTTIAVFYGLSKISRLEPYIDFTTATVQCIGDFTIRLVDCGFYMFGDPANDDNAFEERESNVSAEAFTKKFVESLVVGLAEGVADGTLKRAEIITTLGVAGMITTVDYLTTFIPDKNSVPVDEWVKPTPVVM